MRKLVGFLFLVVGVAVFLHGYSTSESVLNDFLELLTGPAGDSTVWYMIAGGLATLLGLSLTLGASKPSGAAA